MAAWLERSEAAKQNMLTVSGEEATVGNGQGAEAGQVCWHMSLHLATQIAAAHVASSIAVLHFPGLVADVCVLLRGYCACCTPAAVEAVHLA